MYLDAHCHLEQRTYGGELPAVLERAFAAGISHLVAVGASDGAKGAREVVELAETHPQIYAAVGIHPHDAAKATRADFEMIANLLAHPKVVALGEIGLDYYYDHSPRDVQRDVVLELLAQGRQRNVPIMLHVRDAHADMLAFLDQVGVPERGGVVHCFTAGPDEAGQYLARGLDLSIPGVITFKNAEALRAAVREAPIERILLETDCPYLAPIPYRGKRNEPSYLLLTAEAVGREKGLSGEEMGRIARDNALRRFGIPA